VGEIRSDKKWAWGNQESHSARIIHECRREAFDTEARGARGSDDVAGIHE